MAARHSRTPSSALAAPIVMAVVVALLTAAVVYVGVRWRWLDAGGIALATVPVVGAELTIALARRHRPRGVPLLVPAEERRLIDSTVKLLLVQIFAVGLASLAGLAPPNFPLFASGNSLVAATLIGVTSWVLLGDVLVTVWQGERAPLPSTSPPFARDLVAERPPHVR